MDICDIPLSWECLGALWEDLNMSIFLYVNKAIELRTITLAIILMTAIVGLGAFGAYAATQSNQWASAPNGHSDDMLDEMLSDDGMTEDMYNEGLDSEMEEMQEHCFDIMRNHGVQDHEEHDHP
ncbi:MAG: hypothetical protein LN417_01635 [Candidatus Thermoplasmatota archaeon]|nr:hypothetical protein [Candidatus Thermoplasmatota archaeon]